MRKLLIFLMTLALLVSSASAVPPISGGAQGIHVKNIWVDGNSVIAGTNTAGIAITSTGSIGADTTWAAGFDNKAAAGTGEIDWSAATGTTKTTTGDNTLGGDTYIASGKDIRGVGGNSLFDMSMCSGAFLTPTGAVTLGPGAVGITGNIAQTGATTLSTGTGATTLNGPVGVAAGVDIVAAGAGSDIDYALSTTGIFVTPGGAVTIGPGAIGVTGTQTIASGKDIIAAGSTSDIDFSLSSGFMKTPTGAITMSGATTWLADKGIAYTSGTGAADFSLGSGIFKTTTGAVTIGPGAISHSGDVTNAKTVSYSLNATTSLDTVLTSTSTKTVYAIDASGADATITLPDAATVTGRMYYIAIKTDPGTYFARIKATAGKLGGASGIAAATGLKDTDVAGGITLVSDGANYLIVGQYFPVGGAGWVSG
jgi:hypothetical protein